MRSNMEIGESTFPDKDHGLAINDEDLVPANLDSIDNLVGFVSRKRRMV